ncbi:MAG: hypothetical protein IJ416_11650 [Ruminiclostridium sp.]|nr:hypothetical protein [Ruminiclostridium sp.]
MKRYIKVTAVLSCLIACLIFSVAAFAQEIPEELTESDKWIFGVFPVWLFLLILALVVMVAIIIIIEIFKRKHK